MLLLFLKGPESRLFNRNANLSDPSIATHQLRQPCVQIISLRSAALTLGENPHTSSTSFSGEIPTGLELLSS